MTSIQRRLSLGLLLGFAVLLGAGGAVIYLMTRVALCREFDTSLKARALTMAALPKAEHGRVEFEFRESAPLGGRTNASEFFQFFAADGSSLRRSRSLGRVDLPQQFGTLLAPEFWDLTLPNGAPGRALGVRFVARGEHEGLRPQARAAPGAIEIGLVLAADRSHLNETLTTLAAIVLGAGSLTLVATGLLIPLVLRKGLSPVQRLAAQAEAIDALSLKTRFPTDRLPVELAPIAHRLNDLLSRLEASFERERRFSSDLAHELRTPIAALRTISEVSLKWSEGADPESFQAVLEIAGQMQDMITRLLALARAEQKILPIEPVPVAMDSLVEALWRPHEEKAVRKHLKTRFQVRNEARIETDPTLFRGILLNLITNAVDYTPAGGWIRIAFTPQGERFTLTVTNTVDNLETSDLPRLFERFWRKDKARSDAEHSGLGLSLVRSFATLLGLELTADLDAGSELRFSLRGPLRPQWQPLAPAPL